MNTIVHQIIEKIISGSNENLESLFKKDKDISTYILNTKGMLNGIGTDLVKMALEMADEIVKESSSRKENWNVQRKADEKVLLTLFGEVNYKRTYYKHKHNKEYSYLSDEILCLSPHERMDASLEAELITKTTDLSYEKSGKRSATNLRISKQTVMNSIRNLGALDYDALIPTTNLKDQKKVKIIYIEADEDHVAMQDGSNRQVRLIYVHGGRKKQAQGVRRAIVSSSALKYVEYIYSTFVYRA
ncbi:MAG: hypothetical protein GX308_08750 [Epulopiscium sp.]|nr:hypothetical protein [Candidatus Epulonipiscium sp.]